MTSLSPRKPRTTAPRTRAGTAFRVAVLLALAGGPAVAQYPARQSQPSLASVGARQPDKKSDDKKDEKKESLEQKEKEDRERYLRLPPREVVFAFPNDEELEQAILNRLRADEKAAGRNPFDKYPAGLRFPKLPDVGGDVVYEPKTSTYPPARVNYEPLYVTHRRLHFEELNAERYGWDLGIIHPLVSAMHFYKDVLLWPNSLASGCAYGFWDTSAGKCLPGSPTPYMLYPPGLTITGTTFEAVIITGAAFAFP